MAEAIVTVEQGKLRGRTGTDFTGRQFCIFQGIPYAKPPIGSLRFKDPQPPEPWEGFRDATKPGSESIQRHIFQQKFVGSEDCLYLNVYTPQVSKNDGNTLRPVMFWIHGGGFSGGSGNTEIYGPEYLIPHNIVLVTANYRLGVLGFLKLDDPALEVPGNAGLKDIVAALHWVKKNIKSFYGDPNNVTVFGESAGSSAVQYLLASPLASDLFHKAIMQSGSIFNAWSSGHQRNGQYAQVLGLKSTDEKQILEALQSLSASELFEFQEKLNDSLFDGSRRPFGPGPEKPSQSAFLPDEPIKIIRSGTYKKVPLMIGYCDAEGITSVFWEPLHGRETVHKDFENFVPFTFDLEKGSKESLQIAQRVKSFYYGNKEPSSATLQNYVELESDAYFIHAIQKSVENAVQKSKEPVYFYRFCFDGEHNFLKSFTKYPYKGASHADELGYLFKTISQVENFKPGSAEEVTMQRLTKLWTNFAKYGDPNPKETNDLINIRWEPTGSNGLNYLNIDRELSVGVNPDAKRMEFWDKIYDDYPFAKYW